LIDNIDHEALEFFRKSDESVRLNPYVFLQRC
jgi:hypothetical protein